MHIYPYKFGSRSATALADALDIRQIRHEGSRFVGGPQKTVINWGASELPREVARCNVLNKVDNVRRAGNKLHTFQRLAQDGVSVPLFTGSANQAIDWLEKNNYTVVARKVLTGHSGQGIIVLDKGMDFVEAPLYTRYVPKDREYRVHVVRGQIIDVQRKVKDPDREVTDWKVRSHGNGFIFIRNTEDGKSYKEACEAQVRTVAVQTAQCLALDFAAVDVIWNKRHGRAYVLEANCAPGISGETINVYAEAFRPFLRA